MARSFSGDKEQLVPILKAGLAHRGFALIDVISPCVTFNDHEGSTNSYLYTRQHLHEATEANFVPPRARNRRRNRQARAARTSRCTMAASCASTRVPDDYDVTDRMAAMQYLREHPAEVVTGILYADESVPDMHEMNRTSPHRSRIFRTRSFAPVRPA